jgi:PAS domain S-box-containing protein
MADDDRVQRNSVALIGTVRTVRAEPGPNDALVQIAGRIAKLGGWVVSVPDLTVTWADETAFMHDEAAGFSPTTPGLVAYAVDECREQMLDALHACARTGLPFDLELQVLTAKSRRLWVRLIGAAVCDETGAVSRVQGALQDISGQKRADEELQSLSLRLHETLENISDAFFTLDRGWRFTYLNGEAERLLHRKRSQLLGHHIWTEFPEAAGTESDRAYSRAMNERVTATFEQFYPPLDRSFTVAAHPTREGVAVYFHDVTERKKLEAQFLRAQRMESIGSLAGGIAHDLNNTLVPILVTASALRADETDPSRLEDLATIETCAQRGADMVRQLLAFARGSGGRRTQIDLGKILADIQKLVRDTFPKDISLQVNVEPRPWELNADSTQIHQLLTNLCVNARDAMPHGGNLTVTVEHVVLDDVYAGMNLEAKPGRYVLVRVEDTGAGIPPAIVDRIFEPFFTTKEFGKGTGLGLSTAHAIVRSHGGFIHVYSEVGKGTRFKVHLPVETPDAVLEEAAAAPETPKLPRGNGECVLVVDDEEAIRVVARRTLERFGYRVLLASNGAEAVSLYAQHRDDVAVVLTDMSMPVMDGPATIIALRTLNPRVRIIGSSGLMSGGTPPGSPAARLHHFVSKPYTADIILTMLKTVLRDAPGYA